MRFSPTRSQLYPIVLSLGLFFVPAANTTEITETTADEILEEQNQNTQNQPPLSNTLDQSEQQQLSESPSGKTEGQITHGQSTTDNSEYESLPKAENIDLSDPVVEEQVDDTEALAAETPNPQQAEAETPTPSADHDAPAASPPAADAEALVILNTLVERGTTTRLSWSPDQSLQGIATPTPVLIAHGAKPGPKLCLTAAVHGDELNGIEIVRSVMYDIEPKELSGSVIAVPIVNLQGFRRGSRYLTDRRDLNRFFPGNSQGSSASRIAHSFFNQVISHCDLLVDLHTGSFYRTNLPQLRANTLDPKVLELTQAFDAIAVLHSEGATGTLRRAAVDIGVPAVTLEAGGPMELNETYVEQGVKAINTLLDKMGMMDTISFWGTPQPIYYASMWVRADQGGILFSEIKLGARVRKGDLLGIITDPITNVRSLVLSPVNGRILGMAVNQVVLPGFAAYHIGIDPDSATPASTSTPSREEGAQDNDEEEEFGYDAYD